MFSLSGKSKNQIPCFPCAVATLLLTINVNEQSGHFHIFNQKAHPMDGQHTCDGRTTKGRLLWTKRKINSWQIYAITERIEPVQFHVKSSTRPCLPRPRRLRSTARTCVDCVGSRAQKKNSHRNSFRQPYHISNTSEKKIIR